MSTTFYAGREIAPRSWSYIDSVEGLNLATRNAHDVVVTLQYPWEDFGMEPVPVNEFIARCTAILRNHLGKPDAGIETVELKGDGGAQMIDCGRADGYIVLKIRQLITLARDGAAAGGTHIYAA